MDTQLIIRPLMGLALLVLGLAGCRAEGELAFVTIEHLGGTLESTGISGYVSTEPALFVVTNAKQGEVLADISLAHNTTAREYLRSLDYERYLALVVFSGLMPSSAYGAEIQRIVQEGNTVTVYTHFTERDPAREATTVVT